MSDDLDREILRALTENARISFADLGRRVGLSPHGAADRVRRLRESGVIRAFTVELDLETVGRPVDAYIDARLPATTVPEDFEELAGALPQVREVTFVTGRYDYVIRVACRDADELDRTVRALRRGGAAYTETRMVLRSASVKRVSV